MSNRLENYVKASGRSTTTAQIWTVDKSNFCKCNFTDFRISHLIIREAYQPSPYPLEPPCP